jgi:Ca2+-binding EF-hand superfamily protein
MRKILVRKNFAEYFAAAALAATPLVAQDQSDLFSKLDANKDGYVTPDEVTEQQRALYDRMLRTSDKDGDKKLSKEEFLAGLRPDETPRQPLAGGAGFGGPRGDKGGDPREFFSRLDANKDGKLSKDEMPERLRENFARLDSNGDGFVSLEEFGQVMRQFAPPGKAPPGKAPPGAPAATPANDQARRVAEAFDLTDANKDGKLTKDEIPVGKRDGFGAMVERLNPGQDFVTKEQYIRGMAMLAQAGGALPPAGQRPNAGNLPSREDLEALFDRTDSNSDGKLTKDEIPEERRGMRGVLEQSGGDSINKEQFVRGMMAMAQQFGGQQPRPDGAPRPEGARPEGARPDSAGQRPEGAPPRRPDGAPGGPPPGGPGGGLFGMLDTDRNGELSTAEIVAAGSTLLKLDKNGDGKLTPDEVFAGAGGPPGGMRGRPGDGQPGVGQPGNGRPGQRGFGGMNPDELRQRLKEADTNGDGKLSKEEAPAMIKDRFDRIDANSDGFIDENEMRQMFRRMAEGTGNK